MKVFTLARAGHALIVSDVSVHWIAGLPENEVENGFVRTFTAAGLIELLDIPELCETLTGAAAGTLTHI